MDVREPGSRPAATLRAWLAGAALASGISALAANAAADDSPELGSTPVARYRKPSAPTGSEPAWLSGIDPNVIPASGLVSGRSTDGSVPAAPGNPPPASQPGGMRFPKIFDRSKAPPSMGMPGADASSPNTPLQGTTINGAPLLAGPPAYRWFGYGAPTPGANTFAPTGQYPKGSANWFGVTGATPGAFPVSVVNPYHAGAGNEPPQYAAAPPRPTPVVRNPVVRNPVNRTPPPNQPHYQPLPDYLLSEGAAPRMGAVNSAALPPKTRMEAASGASSPLPPPRMDALPPPRMDALPPPRMDALPPPQMGSGSSARTALPPLPDPVGVPQMPPNRPASSGSISPASSGMPLPPLPEPVKSSSPVSGSSLPLPPSNNGILLPPEKPPEIKAPQIKAPDMKVPEIKAPDMKVPEIKVPEIKAPDMKVPEIKAPVNGVKPPAPGMDRPIVGLPVPRADRPKPLPPAIQGDPWQATPVQSRPAAPGTWNAAPQPAAPLPPPNLPEPGASNVPTAPVARGQMPDANRPDPLVTVIHDVCRGRAAGVDVRWTGSKQLAVCFEVRSAAEATQLVRDISARRELGPLAIDFCVLVK